MPGLPYQVAIPGPRADPAIGASCSQAVMGCGEAKDWFRMTQRHQNLSVNVELSDGRVTGGDEKMAVPRREEHDRCPGPGDEPLAGSEPVGLEPHFAGMIPSGVEEVHSPAPAAASHLPLPLNAIPPMRGVMARIESMCRTADRSRSDCCRRSGCRAGA